MKFEETSLSTLPDPEGYLRSTFEASRAWQIQDYTEKNRGRYGQSGEQIFDNLVLKAAEMALLVNYEDKASLAGAALISFSIGSFPDAEEKFGKKVTDICKAMVQFESEVGEAMSSTGEFKEVADKAPCEAIAIVQCYMIMEMEFVADRKFREAFRGVWEDKIKQDMFVYKTLAASAGKSPLDARFEKACIAAQQALSEAKSTQRTPKPPVP